MKLNCLVDFRRLLSDPVYRAHIQRFHSITFTHWPQGVDDYALMRRCHDWARSNGIEVRGKALFFTRGCAKDPAKAQARWDAMAKRVEQITQDFDCCLWEVAAEAWSTASESRHCEWSMEPAESWVEEAFRLYADCTDALLYYADFGAYHPGKLQHGVIPALSRMKGRGTRVDGFSLQLASSLFPRIPLDWVRTINQQAQSAGLQVEWPENIAWDVVGRWRKITPQQFGPAVEMRQAQIYRDYQRLATELGIERSSVWFPWAGHSYHWRWDTATRRRQASDCGLWRSDWSPKPALAVMESFLRAG